MPRLKAPVQVSSRAMLSSEQRVLPGQRGFIGRVTGGGVPRSAFCQPWTHLLTGLPLCQVTDFKQKGNMTSWQKTRSAVSAYSCDVDTDFMSAT